MLEYLHASEKPPADPNTNPDMPPVANHPYAPMTGPYTSRYIYPNTGNPSMTGFSGHSTAYDYHGNYMIAPCVGSAVSAVIDLTVLVGTTYGSIGTVPDGGWVCGSHDLGVLWFTGGVTGNTLRRWKRSPTNQEKEYTYTKSYDVPYDTLGTAQAINQQPVTDSSGRMIYTGSYVREYDDSGLVKSFLVGNDVHTVRFSENGKRMVTFSGAPIVIKVYDKDENGDYVLKTTFNSTRTFVIDLLGSNMQNWLRVSGNHNLSRFAFSLDGRLYVHSVTEAGVVAEIQTLNVSATVLTGAYRHASPSVMDRTGRYLVSVLGTSQNGGKIPTFQWNKDTGQYVVETPLTGLNQNGAPFYGIGVSGSGNRIGHGWGMTGTPNRGVIAINLL